VSDNFGVLKPQVICGLKAAKAMRFTFFLRVSGRDPSSANDRAIRLIDSVINTTKLIER
jgi:hypothetical protein